MLVHLLLHRHASSETVSRNDAPINHQTNGSWLVGFHALMRLTLRRIRRAMVEWPGGHAATRAYHTVPVGETSSVINPALRQETCLQPEVERPLLPSASTSPAVGTG